VALLRGPAVRGREMRAAAAGAGTRPCEVADPIFRHSRFTFHTAQMSCSAYTMVVRCSTGTRTICARSARIGSSPKKLRRRDVTKAREIATRKGVGYQTLLKMLVHEGLRREARRS
jgi:hypothetical protein